MRLALVVAATAACSCGRLRFDDVPDAGRTAATTCDWSSGPPFTALPRLHAELSSPVTEVDPFLAPGDPLTMYFGSLRAGDMDQFVATRPTLDAPFEQVRRVDELSTVGGAETGVVLDPTGMTGYFVKNETIHAVVRDVPGGPLRDAGLVPELAIDVVFQDPWPSPDGLSLTFSAGKAPAQIYTASRGSRSEPWTNITSSSVNVSGVTAGGATLTDDQLVMVWAREVAPMKLAIHYTVREDPRDPFVDRGLLLAMPMDKDFEASIRGDGCELFFSREGAGGQDIYSLIATP